MDIFKDFYFQKPLMIGRLPLPILEEVREFVTQGRKYKDSELGFLRNHLNAGRNGYQVSVPKPDVEKSFFFPFIIRCGEYYLNQSGTVIEPGQRRVRLRCNENHFDGYDVWINFTTGDDENPDHVHPGILSAVVYVANDDRVPTIFDNGPAFAGEPGNIVLFPAQLKHRVEKHPLTSERITMSFNLELLLPRGPGESLTDRK